MLMSLYHVISYILTWLFNPILLPFLASIGTIWYYQSTYDPIESRHDQPQHISHTVLPSKFNEQITKDQSFLQCSGTELARLISEGRVTSLELTRLHIAQILRVNPSVNGAVNYRFKAALDEAYTCDAVLLELRAIYNDLFAHYQQTSSITHTIPWKLSYDIDRFPQLLNLAEITSFSLEPMAMHHQPQHFTCSLFLSYILPPFFGVPCTTKECFALQGMPWTSGLAARAHCVAAFTSPVILNMQRSGVVIMATTNTSELCMWMESSNYMYGLTKNPYNLRRTPGGSSGGEATMLSTYCTPFSLGSDVGGSIRMPAFFCGVYGHKPTSRYASNVGQWPPARGGIPDFFCQPGPMARYPADLFPLLQVMVQTVPGSQVSTPSSSSSSSSRATRKMLLNLPPEHGNASDRRTINLMPRLTLRDYLRYGVYTASPSPGLFGLSKDVSDQLTHIPYDTRVHNPHGPFARLYDNALPSPPSIGHTSTAPASQCGDGPIESRHDGHDDHQRLQTHSQQPITTLSMSTAASHEIDVDDGMDCQLPVYDALRLRENNYANIRPYPHHSKHYYAFDSMKDVHKQYPVITSPSQTYCPPTAAELVAAPVVASVPMDRSAIDHTIVASSEAANTSRAAIRLPSNIVKNGLPPLHPAHSLDKTTGVHDVSSLTPYEIDISQLVVYSLPSFGPSLVPVSQVDPTIIRHQRFAAQHLSNLGCKVMEIDVAAMISGGAASGVTRIQPENHSLQGDGSGEIDVDDTDQLSVSGSDGLGGGDHDRHEFKDRNDAHLVKRKITSGSGILSPPRAPGQRPRSNSSTSLLPSRYPHSPSIDHSVVSPSSHLMSPPAAPSVEPVGGFPRHDRRGSNATTGTAAPSPGTNPLGDDIIPFDEFQPEMESSHGLPPENLVQLEVFKQFTLAFNYWSAGMSLALTPFRDLLLQQYTKEAMQFNPKANAKNKQPSSSSSSSSSPATLITNRDELFSLQNMPLQHSSHNQTDILVPMSLSLLSFRNLPQSLFALLVSLLSMVYRWIQHLFYTQFLPLEIPTLHDYEGTIEANRQRYYSSRSNGWLDASVDHIVSVDEARVQPKVYGIAQRFIVEIKIAFLLFYHLCVCLLFPSRDVLLPQSTQDEETSPSENTAQQQCDDNEEDQQALSLLIQHYQHQQQQQPGNRFTPQSRDALHALRQYFLTTVPHSQGTSVIPKRLSLHNLPRNGAQNYMFNFHQFVFSHLPKTPFTFPALLLSLIDRVGELAPSQTLKLWDQCLAFSNQLNLLLAPSPSQPYGAVLLCPAHPKLAPGHHMPCLKPFNFVYTGIFNATMSPVTSVPLGLHLNIPTGIQVVGARHCDAVTIATAIALHKRFGGWSPGKKLHSKY